MDSARRSTHLPGTPRDRFSPYKRDLSNASKWKFDGILIDLFGSPGPKCPEIQVKLRLKPRGNGRNIVGQHLPTLLDVTCPVRLHTLLHVVGKCCTKFEPVRLLSQHLPTFLLFHDRRSVAQQCWIRLHSSSLTAHPKLLVPRTRITRGLQSLMGCIFSIIHCSSQHWWKLLHPFASVRNLVTEKQ